MQQDMVLTTTSTIEGYPVQAYLGVVCGEVVMGVNILKDFLAGLRDIVGGRSETYENQLQEARERALAEMKQRAAALGANAVLGIDFDYEVLGQNNGMLMVSVSGTAVRCG